MIPDPQLVNTIQQTRSPQQATVLKKKLKTNVPVICYMRLLSVSKGKSRRNQVCVEEEHMDAEHRHKILNIAHCNELWLKAKLQ